MCNNNNNPSNPENGFKNTKVYKCSTAIINASRHGQKGSNRYVVSNKTFHSLGRWHGAPNGYNITPLRNKF